MSLRRTISLAAALLAATALTACGSKTTVVTDTGGPSTATGSGTAGTPSSSSTPTAPTATTHSTPTITTATHGAPRCTAAMLKLSSLGQQGATGHGELGFSLTNISGHGCHTFGYPGVLFLSQNGQSLPTVPIRTTQDFFGKAPAVALSVAPGAAVSFRLGVTHGASSTAGCTTAHALQVIPPDDTATLRTGIANGGAYECRTVTVSPLRPGTRAYP
ncbi:MAG: DUF4232 domain-containing protein [Actinomycetota bacterium]|nr:DUF4232 domain-containing protein [Actinomycetota bacterium]